MGVDAGHDPQPARPGRRQDENLLVVEGAVPGPKDGYVVITKAKKPPRERRGFGGVGHGRSVEGFEAPGGEEEVSSSCSCSRQKLASDGSRQLNGLTATEREEIMATIDVLNLGGEKVGIVRPGRRSFRRSQRRPALGSGEALPRRAACRNPRHQDPRSGERRGQEALEAEGHGPRACRVDPFATVAARRHGPRTASPAPTTTRSRARSCWVRCARRWRRSCRTASWSWSTASS